MNGPGASGVAVGDALSADELSAAGVELPADFELPAEVDETTIARFNSPEVRALGVPGAGGYGTAADFALLYQHLLHDPLGLFDPQVLAAGTSVLAANGPDLLRGGVDAQRTLGLVRAGDAAGHVLRGFPPNVSERAFGHDGVGGQSAWADPVSGLSFCFLTSGYDLNPVRQRRLGLGAAKRAVAAFESG